MRIVQEDTARRLSDYDQGFSAFRLRNELPMCASKMMVEGYNASREHTITFEAAKVLTRARLAGHSVEGMDDIARELAAQDLPPKASLYYKSDRDPDAGKRDWQAALEASELRAKDWNTAVTSDDVRRQAIERRYETIKRANAKRRAARA